MTAVPNRQTEDLGDGVRSVLIFCVEAQQVSHEVGRTRQLILSLYMSGQLSRHGRPKWWRSSLFTPCTLSFSNVCGPVEIQCPLSCTKHCLCNYWFRRGCLGCSRVTRGMQAKLVTHLLRTWYCRADDTESSSRLPLAAASSDWVMCTLHWIISSSYHLLVWK